ncbi:MAG: CAAD domain-containing protein [Mojavia pulchra JT2-VF2]|jgi:hypothetical protein|uniref:CAAD domain-containing protein n=1 Tax=Mojavia pulchra JT2-VF2 TaxID=287848 RepID=A0A951UEW8_9NOST|nr:CAAD domain-containing protein [Mojavia pulchra JT2-VF2]
METEQQQVELVDSTSPEGTMALVGTENETLPKLPPAKEPDNQWQEIGKSISDFLAELPEYLGRFFNEYKQPLLTIGALVLAIVALRVVLAILSAVNSIPLLMPTFELIGIGYTAWFTSRYLLKASTRQELVNGIRDLQQEVVGEEHTENLN